MVQLECTFAMALTQRELDHQYRMRKVQAWQNACRYCVIAICVSAPFAFLYLAARQFAGKETLADIAFRATADLKANEPISNLAAWCLAGLTGTWGYSERFLRRRYIRKTAPVLQKFEANKNPKRMTSGLTPEGRTQEEDE
jgi:hypothetical protein